MSKVYRHYGSSSFIPELVYPVTRSRTIKPVGGLWASPVDSKNSWYNWCISEHWDHGSLSKHFDFVIDDHSKIFQINSLSDLKCMIDRFPGRCMEKYESNMYRSEHSELHLTHFPDYVKLSKMYDGVEISITNCPELYYAMYGWGVDSLVIWNRDMIILI